MQWKILEIHRSEMFKWTSWLVRVNFRQVSLRLTTTFKAHRTAGFFKHSTLVLFWWSGTWRCLHDKKKFSRISIKIEAETRSRRCSDSRWKKIHPTGDHSIVVSMLRISCVLVFTLCGLPISFARWLIWFPWSSWHWWSKFRGKWRESFEKHEKFAESDRWLKNLDFLWFSKLRSRWQLF